MINPPPTHWIQRIGMITLPLIFAGYWVYAHLIVPTPFYLRYDPEFPYFMSSLTPFKGYLYAFIDHPGTPFQVIGTALLFLTYPFIPGGHDAFIMYHLTHPEVFLTMARALLTLGSMVCAVLLIRHTVRVTHWIDALFAVAVAVSFYAVHPQTFNTLIFWSHNSLNFPAGTLLLWYVFAVFRSDAPIPRWKFLLMGFWAGVLTATQLYFLTWIIGITTAVLLLGVLERAPWGETFWATLHAFGGSVLGFFVSVIPILPIFHTFVEWTIGLIVHQGKYGTGDQGITSPEQLGSNLAELYRAIPFIFLLTGLWLLVLVVIVVLPYDRGPISLRLRALAGGLAIQIGTTLLIILKHPRPTYFLAIVATFPILLALLHTLLAPYRHHAHPFYLAISIAVLLGFCFNLSQTIIQHQTLVLQAQTEHAVTEHFLEHYAQQIDQQRDELTILWTYGNYHPCFALSFGNTYTNLTKNAFASELDTLCSHGGRLIIWNDGLTINHHGTFTPVEDAPWDVIVMSKFATIVFPRYSELGFVSRRLDGNRAIFFVTRQNP